jgi:hypothetical protein
VAKCDEGYRCDVCGRDVETVLESDLYLRYVLSEVLLEALHLQSERHIRCNPAMAQYIVSDDFPSLHCEGPFSKSQCDADYVQSEERRITRGWKRLVAIPTLGISIAEYPLHVTPET